MSRKVALIIGNSEYEDERLARLVTPTTDASALADVLRDPEVGGFDEVESLINQPATVIRRTIASFFARRERDDLLLLYFSGHGIRDDRGQLFLAVKDTEHHLLRGTAIPASFVTEEMDNNRSRRQVLILDCCHSGAFSRGMKGTPGASVGTAAAFEGTGSGRVVLTATDSTQYAWEGDRVIGKAENSVFTHYLIQGLRTGQADTNADGQITLDELYNYVYEQVVHQTSMQTPGKWSYGQRGEIVLAKNPHPVPGEPQNRAVVGNINLELLAQRLSMGLELTQRKIAGTTRQLRAILREEQPSLWFTSIGWAMAFSLGLILGQFIAEIEIRRGVELQFAFLNINRGWLVGFTIAGALSGFVGGTTTALALRRRKPSLSWIDLWLIVLGWTVGMALVGFYFPMRGGVATGALIGGLTTGLICWKDHLSLKLHQILILFIVLIGSEIMDIASMVMNRTVGYGAIIGSLIVGLVLWWAERSISWKQIVLLAIAWNLGWTMATDLSGWFLGITLIGCGMWLALRKTPLFTQWQYTLITGLGWAIGISVGMSILQSMTGSWSGDAEVLRSMFHAAAGIVGGATGGIIGIMTTLWAGKIGRL